MKTKEELKALKEKEVETESKEPRKLTDEELAQVSGGESVPGPVVTVPPSPDFSHPQNSGPVPEGRG